MPSGSPAPRLRVAPPAEDTYGDLAVDFAGDYGLTADDWQRLILDDWLAVSGGRWASLKCGLSVARQNGKNAALEIRELFGMVGRGEQILHTAHQVKTAQKHFRRLKYFFGRKVADSTARFPELNALVVELRRVNGQEAIYLSNGGSVELAARSAGANRGYTVDVIVCDEAQDMTDDDLEAILSTSSAGPKGDPQWIFTGTPPGPKAAGVVFSRNRAEILDGKARKSVWHEWAAEVGDDLDDREVWARANPGLVAGRLLVDVVEAERSTLSDEGFMRERLGMWVTRSSRDRGVVPFDAWADRRDEASAPVDRFALGVEVGPDLAWASVALAGQRADGDWHVELDENRTGANWLVAYLQGLLAANPRVRCIVGDVGGPLAALLDQKGTRYFLAGTRVEVTPLSVKDLGAACAQALSGTVTGWLHHLGQPQLDAAVQTAGKRALGDTGMWVFSRRSASSDITPVQSATYALWGAQSGTVRRRRDGEQTRATRASQGRVSTGREAVRA